MVKVLIIKDEGATEFPKGYNYMATNSESNFMQHIREYKEFPDFSPYTIQEMYDDPEFNTLNDFILSPVDKMLISYKAKNILENFNLPNYRFYPAQIKRVKYKILGIKIKSTLKNYCRFSYDGLYIDDFMQYVDFNKTNVIVKNGKGEIVKTVIQSSDQIHQMIQQNGICSNQSNEIQRNKSLSNTERQEKIKELAAQQISFEVDEVYMRQDFAGKLDLFELPIFSSMTLISEALSERLEKDNITGIKVVETGVKSRLNGIKNPKVII